MAGDDALPPWRLSATAGARADGSHEVTIIRGARAADGDGQVADEPDLLCHRRTFERVALPPGRWKLRVGRKDPKQLYLAGDGGSCWLSEFLECPTFVIECYCVRFGGRIDQIKSRIEYNT